MLVCLTKDEILKNILSAIAAGNIIVKDTSKELVEIEDNTVVITDACQEIPLIKKLFPPKNKNALIFISSFVDDFIKSLIMKNKPLENSFKFRFLKNIINQIHTPSGIVSNISYLPVVKNSITETFFIEGNLKNLAEEALDTIISFTEYFSIDDKVDRGDIVISTSEIIDNIVEANIYLNRLIAKIKISLSLSSESLEITIGDYLGIADMYLISSSLEGEVHNTPVEVFDKEIEDIVNNVNPRGRGYTLIKRTSDNVITKIVGPESFKKYREDYPCTETTVIYFFNRDDKRIEERIGMVIGFF